MTLTEFFEFLYRNDLDYSVNVLRNQKRSCSSREYMIIAISNDPLFVRMCEDYKPLFLGLPQDVTIKKGRGIEFQINGSRVYVITIDLKIANMNSDTLLTLAKKIWEEYIHAGH